MLRFVLLAGHGRIVARSTKLKANWANQRIATIKVLLRRDLAFKRQLGDVAEEPEVVMALRIVT